MPIKSTYDPRVKCYPAFSQIKIGEPFVFHTRLKDLEHRIVYIKFDDNVAVPLDDFCSGPVNVQKNQIVQRVELDVMWRLAE